MYMSMRKKDDKEDLKRNLKVNCSGVNKHNYNYSFFGDFKDRHEKIMHLVFYGLKHFAM